MAVKYEYYHYEFNSEHLQILLYLKYTHEIYVYTYPRLVPAGVAKIFYVFLQNTHVYQNDLAMRNNTDMTNSHKIIHKAP
jgi:hypothetical protein